MATRVAEEEGVPIDVPGLAGIDADAEIRRLDSIVRDGVDPRIPVVRIRAIVGFAGGPVLIFQIPQCWA